MRVTLLLCASITIANAFAPPAFSGAAVARAAPARTATVVLDAKKKKKDLQTPKPVRERKVKDDKIEVDGVVTEGNGQLEEDPALVNSDPEGEGWFFRMTLSDKSQLDGLMNADVVPRGAAA